MLQYGPTKIAYGIHITHYNNPAISQLLEKYDSVIGFDTEMSMFEKGSVFVYFKSTYQEIFNKQRLYIHCFDNERPVPHLSEFEKQAIQDINVLNYGTYHQLCWVKFCDS